jgi:FkbM family methyltransferase
VAAQKRFTSYSTNFEDVILNRVFQDQSQGFFVDVGAAHPVFENDLKALYDRGWRGINIEPITAFFHELAAQRPEDRNLNVAISESSGEIVVHEVVGTGLSTCEPEAAEHARQQGYEVIARSVPTMTLREILTDAAAPRDISVLKVDVEGLELSVMRSNDWDRFRPKLIVAEVTFPETPVRRPDHVGPFLEAQGYRHVYFDGLNDFFAERYFVPPDGAFALPPNVFDGFKLFTQQMAEDARGSFAAEAAALRGQLEHAGHELARVVRRAEASSTDVAAARAELAAMHEHTRAMAKDLERADLVAAQLRDHIHAMYHSTSWKVTRPLRAIVQPRHAMRLIARRLAR